MNPNKLRLTDDDGNAHISGAINRDDPSELLVGEVRSKVKNKGFGSRLLKSLENLAKSRGVTKSRVVLGKFEDTDVQALRRFYENNGYDLNDENDLVVATKKKL
jgi:GNAT superfamily N-acetyltransferase